MERVKKPTIVEVTAKRAKRGPSLSVVEAMKAEVSALKRDRILEAATQLFLKNGYHGTSLEAIAQAIGVTKPFIYYQFHDKADILAAICSLGAELTLSALDQAEAQDKTATERMRWFCEKFTELVVEWGRYLAVYLGETANLDEAARKDIMRLRGEIDVRVTKLVSAGVESGEFQVEDAAIAARAVTTMISYVFLWHHKDRPPALDKFTEIITNIAMRTLCAAPQNRPVHNSIADK